MSKRWIFYFDCNAAVTTSLWRRTLSPPPPRDAVWTQEQLDAAEQEADRLYRYFQSATPPREG